MRLSDIYVGLSLCLLFTVTGSRSSFYETYPDTCNRNADRELLKEEDTWDAIAPSLNNVQDYSFQLAGNWDPGQAKDNSRTKRHAPSMRTRIEIRQLTRKEFLHFADIIHRLKVLIHPGSALTYWNYFIKEHLKENALAAHKGPAFIAWHRKCMMILEEALKEVSGKTMAVPYWDSSLEHRLSRYLDNADGEDYSKSAIFGDHYLGTANGRVENGLFNHTRIHGVCARDIDRYVTREYNPSPQKLLSRKKIENLKTLTSYTDFCKPFNKVFESNHGGVHMNLGGHLANLTCAPADILFWLHHSFVDYLWETSRGNTPAHFKFPTDRQLEPYMEKTPALRFHRANSPIRPFSTKENPIRNKDVIRPAKDFHYKYAPAPSTIVCHKHADCKSSALWCDVNKRHCVPKIQPHNLALPKNAPVAESIYCPEGQEPYVKSSGYGLCRSMHYSG